MRQRSEHPFPEIERMVSESWQAAEEERLRQQLPYAGLLLARPVDVPGLPMFPGLMDMATAQHSWALQLLTLEELAS